MGETNTEKSIELRTETLYNQNHIKNITPIKQLAIGKYGEVWEMTAHYKQRRNRKWTRFKFAVKLIPQKTKNNLQDFNEVLVMRSLRHSNICHLFDDIQSPELETIFPFYKLAMFLELCDGNLETLMLDVYGHMENGIALPEHLSRHLFKQLITGLEYLHRRKIIHNDLVPRHILYQFNDLNDSQKPFEERFQLMVFKIADYGLSHRLSPLVEVPDRPFLPNTYNFITLTYEDTDQNYQEVDLIGEQKVFDVGMKWDIIFMANMLFKYAIPFGNDFNEIMKRRGHLKYYLVELMLYNLRYQQIMSPDLVDLAHKMNMCRIRNKKWFMTASQFLGHMFLN